MQLGWQPTAPHDIILLLQAFRTSHKRQTAQLTPHRIPPAQRTLLPGASASWLQQHPRPWQPADLCSKHCRLQRPKRQGLPVGACERAYFNLAYPCKGGACCCSGRITGCCCPDTPVRVCPVSLHFRKPDVPIESVQRARSVYLPQSLPPAGLQKYLGYFLNVICACEGLEIIPSEHNICAL